MAEPFLGEIRLMSFVYAPKGWALCNGQLMAINQNQALFSLLGTNYGGDGRVTFGLPNLQGRIPMHQGQGWLLGHAAGEYSHTLTQAELPAHAHPIAAASATQGGHQSPDNRFLGGAGNVYHPAQTPLTPLRGETVANAGGGQPHENMQPYLTLSFCIALIGIYPSQS
jgi:microcystin-dependent protein